MTSLTLVRRIAARPSIVFDAMTTSQGVAAWWGPDDLPVIAAEMDARVGGAWRVRFHTRDGAEHEARGEFLELDPPARAVMSWRWAVGGEPDERGRTSRIEFDVRSIEGGSELTFTHAELHNDVSRASHQGGWNGALDKLVRQFAEARPA